MKAIFSIQLAILYNSKIFANLRQFQASYAGVIAMKVGTVLQSIWLHCTSLIRCASGCNLSASKIIFFHFPLWNVYFSKLQVVIFHFQLALHTGSVCSCVTNTSLDSTDNRWRVQLWMIKCCDVHILADQSDVSARNPCLDPLVSVPVLGFFVSLFLYLHFNVYFYPLLSLFLQREPCLSLYLSSDIPFGHCWRINLGVFLSWCWQAENFVREGA